VVKVWDATSGVELHTLRGHYRRVTATLFVGSNWIITASEDGSAKSFNIATGMGNSQLAAPRPAPSDPSLEDSRAELAAEYAEVMQRANQMAENELFEQAAEEYSAAVALRPLYAEPNLRLGDCLLALDRLPEAIEGYRNAVKLRPESGWIMYRLGAALVRSDQAEEAIAVLRQSVHALPDNARARLLFGKLLLETRHFEAAKTEFAEATNLLPNSHEALYGLAVAHAGLHQWQKATVLFTDIINVHPDYAPAYGGLVNAILSADPRRAREAKGWADLARQQGVEIDGATSKRLENAAQNL